MNDEKPTCSICQKPIEEGSKAVASRKGKIANYGGGPLFSVRGHRGLFHKRCFEQVVGPHVRPDGDDDIDTWIDRHLPVNQRVVSAAANYDSPAGLAKAVQNGSILRMPNVGEETCKRVAELLLADGLIEEPPGYLPLEEFS